MGFMDKAKKMAEQAQQKLDEVQKEFNQGQGQGQGGQGPQGGPGVRYDEHGRPIGPQEPAAPTAPAGGAGVPTQPDTPTPDPAAPGASPDSSPAKQQGDPLLSDEPGSRHGADAERGDAKPPTPPSSGSGMTSGDPLAG